MSPDVVLRAVTPDDDAFLVKLYGTTRPEVSMFGWDTAEQQAFVRMQFDMQTRSYTPQYPNAEHSIITLSRRDAGRLIVNRSADAITLTDIAVLPEFRGRGIATSILERLQGEAVRNNRPLDLTVERTN